MKMRLLPDRVLEVVLSGLLDATWGKSYRSTIVRFFVYEERVGIGVGEGNIKEWEIDALRGSPIKPEWTRVVDLDRVTIPGIKYIKERTIWGQPTGLLPIQSKDVALFVSRKKRFVFPAYRCFDINLGSGRSLSIISPQTVIRDFAETTHPVFPEEKYRGRVNNVEVDGMVLDEYFEEGYGIGALRKTQKMLRRVKGKVEACHLLGNRDIEEILSKIKSKNKTLNEPRSSCATESTL